MKILLSQYRQIRAMKKSQSSSTQRLLSIAGSLCLCFTLSGCTESADALARETIAEVVSYKDPAAALEQLRKAELTVRLICSTSDGCNEPVARLIDMQAELLGVLVNAGDTLAIKGVFTSGETLGAMKQKLAPMILDLAHNSTDPEISMLAAQIIGDGSFASKNLISQMDYLFQAWKLGGKDSSGTLATLLSSMGDAPNAYLWASRCTDDCRRKNNIDITTYEQKVRDPAVLDAIKLMSGDPKLLKLPS